MTEEKDDAEDTPAEDATQLTDDELKEVAGGRRRLTGNDTIVGVSNDTLVTNFDNVKGGIKGTDKLKR